MLEKSLKISSFTRILKAFMLYKITGKTNVILKSALGSVVLGTISTLRHSPYTVNKCKNLVK